MVKAWLERQRGDLVYEVPVPKFSERAALREYRKEGQEPREVEAHEEVLSCECLLE